MEFTLAVTQTVLEQSDATGWMAFYVIEYPTGSGDKLYPGNNA